MTFRLSGITVDCADPERLADFWGALLGREPSVPLPGWRRLGAILALLAGVSVGPPQTMAHAALIRIDVSLMGSPGWYVSNGAHDAVSLMQRASVLANGR